MTRDQHITRLIGSYHADEELLAEIIPYSAVTRAVQAHRTGCEFDEFDIQEALQSYQDMTDDPESGRVENAADNILDILRQGKEAAQ